MNGYLLSYPGYYDLMYLKISSPARITFDTGRCTLKPLFSDKAENPHG